MKNTLKQTFIWFSCIYSSITVVASIVNLFVFKQTTDSYFHLLDRAVVVLIPILIYFLIKPFKWKNGIKLLVHYVITVALTMLETFIVGVITQDLAETAYRDQLLNYTIVYIVITLVYAIYFLIKKKKNLSKAE